MIVDFGGEQGVLLALTIFDFDRDERDPPEGPQGVSGILRSSVDEIGIEEIDLLGLALTNIFGFNTLIKIPVNMMDCRIEGMGYGEGLLGVFGRLLIGPEVILFWEVSFPHGEAIDVPNVISFGGNDTMPHGDIDEGVG